MGKKNDIKIGDRLSIRITDDVDELVLEWLNKQENRSKSILKLIAAFAHLEKYGRPELVQLLFSSLLSDTRNGDNKGNLLYNKIQMSDTSDVGRRKMSDKEVVSDGKDDAALDLYDEVFGTLDREKSGNNICKNDLFSAIKSIMR